MTYDEQKMCYAYATMVGIADAIQRIHKMGAYEMLSEDSQDAITVMEGQVQDILNETHKYVSSHTKEEN